MTNYLTFEVLLNGFADLVATKVLARMDSDSTPETRRRRVRLLDVDQAAVYLGRSKASLQHMISSGRLPVVRMDRRVFMDVRDLDLLIENSKNTVN